MRIKVDPKSPGILRSARRYEAKLRRVLALCLKRAARKDQELATLFRDAGVEGVDSVLGQKTATIAFTGKALRGSLFEIYDWSALDAFTVEDIAETLYWSLSQTLREQRKLNHSLSGRSSSA